MKWSIVSDGKKVIEKSRDGKRKREAIGKCEAETVSVTGRQIKAEFTGAEQSRGKGFVCTVPHTWTGLKNRRCHVFP